MATETVSTQSVSVEAGQRGGVGWGLVLTVVAGILMLTALYMALVWAPNAANLTAPAERFAQRIFYFHVPSAWLGFLSFIVAAVVGAIYLITRNERWDIWGVSAVEIGLTFFTMVLVTGSIWAKPTWNTWWTWDPRLTISAIAWLLYVGYLMLRGAIDNPERRARFGAVYALVAAISVPLNWGAIRWWRTIHPAVIAGSSSSSAQGDFALSAGIRTTLFFCVFAFTVFFVVLMYHRIRLETSQRRLEALKQRVLY